ncbi:DUF2789 domain-containing protein [Pseudomonas sp. NPDC096917]|uniref:DUF2789 domain-containing protein n=1 Tax=Pseudomonas sp. NPDC096917 TaxID=3364483 RepID=UPI00383BDD9A
MEASTHSLSSLFEQLGLPAGPTDIEKFVTTHSPLKPGLKLADARFWTTSQADFLRNEILDDADWAEVVDQLNLMLHAKPITGRQN